MADFFPLFLDNGTIEVTTPSHVLNYMHFSSSLSASAYLTTLPDPYYFQTQSADISNAVSTTSSSIFNFTLPATIEQQYYATNTILRVASSNAATTGVRVGLQGANNADTSVIQKVASSLTAFTIRNLGTADAFTFALPTVMPANNAFAPAYVQGILRNSTTSSFNNVVLIQPSTNVSVTAGSGSIHYNQFIGYTSSLTPITSSFGPLSLSGSYIKVISGNDNVTQSVLPPTESLWFSQSLAANVSTTSNTTYSNIFNVAGLTDGITYLVNLFIIAQSAATTTGVQIRAISGSFFNGTIYVPTSATAYGITSSLYGNDIPNSATAFPAANADRLIWGEYTFIKTGSFATHSVQIRSEINASAVTAKSGSVIFYRALN